MKPSFIAFELLSYALAALLIVDARRRRDGVRWISTLVTGMIFGLVLEIILVHTANQGGPHYKYGHFLLNVGNVPICVGVGWGEMLYVSTWTAQRLKLGWPFRPLAAAVLAVNIDLSLDPIAQQEGFWSWIDIANPNFYHVPFDNFLAWFLIVALYALFVRGGFRLADKILHVAPTNVAASLVIPPIAAALALGALFVLRGVSSPLYGLFGQIGTFAIVFAVACLIAWRYALTSRRDHPSNWTVLAVPLAFHLTALLTLLLTHGYDDQPSLIVLIPENLFLGFFAYSWLSLDTMFPPSRRATSSGPATGSAPPASAIGIANDGQAA